MLSEKESVATLQSFRVAARRLADALAKLPDDRAAHLIETCFQVPNDKPFAEQLERAIVSVERASL